MIDEKLPCSIPLIRELPAVLLFLFYYRYAIRESNSIVKLFKNFKEKKSFKPDFGAEGNEHVCRIELWLLKIVFVTGCASILPCRDLWRFLAWGEVSEWPGIL